MVQRKQKKNTNNRRKGRKQRTSVSPYSRYANMLSDPCGSLLVPGIYGDQEGLLARLKSEHTFSSNNSNGTEGFILWVCDTTGRHSQGSNYSQGSIAGSRFTDSSNVVSNDATTPAFTGNLGDVNGEGFSLDDPALALIDVGGVGRDCRTIGGCMKLSYLGSMQSAAGQVAVIENLPASDLINYSVDELFRMSTKVERIGTEVHEVKYRPSPTSQNFRTITGESGVALEDATIDLGKVGARETIIHERNQGLKAYGFAWRGTQNATNLAFEFTKNVEWRPRNDSGLPAVPSRSLHDTPPVHRAERELDQNTNGGWSFQTVETAAGQIAKAAFTGIAGTAKSMALDYALDTLGMSGLALAI